MENTHFKNLSILILASLFISTSGTLGKFIDLPTPVIIWGRCFVGMITLYIYCKVKGVEIFHLSKKERFPFFLSAEYIGGIWVESPMKPANISRH